MRRYWLAFTGLEVTFLVVLGVFLLAGMPFWALLVLGGVAVVSLTVGSILLLAKRKEEC